MVGAADLEPGNLLGVAPIPLMRASIDFFQCADSAPAPSPSMDMPEVAAVSEPSLTAAAATASPSPGLLERFDSPTTYFVPARLEPPAAAFAPHTFALHGPEWTPVAIEQLGDISRREFPDFFSNPRRISAFGL